MNEVLNQLPGWITPILAFIAVAYVRSTLKKVERIDYLSEKISGIETIKDEWVRIKIDLTRLIVQMEQIQKVWQKSGEDITIIQRDMRTIWKHIDEINSKLDAMG